MTESTEKFILENTKFTNGERRMTQASYLDYAKTHHQVTEDTIRAHAAMDKTLVSGAIGVATTDLVTKIATAKENGEDPSGLHGIVKIARPDGQLKIDVDAQFESRNPKTQEPLVRYGRVVVVAKASSLVDEEAEKKAAATITKLLAG
jgi:hypothetical protein